MPRRFDPDAFHDAKLDRIDFSNWPQSVSIHLRSWPAWEPQALRLETILAFHYERSLSADHERHDLYVSIVQDEHAAEWKRRLERPALEAGRIAVYHVIVAPHTPNPGYDTDAVGVSVFCRSFKVLHG